MPLRGETDHGHLVMQIPREIQKPEVITLRTINDDSAKRHLCISMMNSNGVPYCANGTKTAEPTSSGFNGVRADTSICLGIDSLCIEYPPDFQLVLGSLLILAPSHTHKRLRETMP